ncbi:hypothetical protein MRX96_046696 [Rhipicephalus microplus]
MPTQNRIVNFKNKGKDQQEMRRRRNEVSVELRKQRKDDQILKRRNVSFSEDPVSPLHEQNKGSFASVEEMVAGLTSPDPDVQLMATQSVRKMLSRERHPPIDAMIQAGVVPVLVSALANDACPTLQFEAAWALTNIASGTAEQTDTLIQAGAVPLFVRLLGSPHANVCEQAVWALGNIAGDGPNLRDLVLQAGILKPLLALARPDAPAPFIRNVTWSLSNLCRNKNPPPPFETIRECLPALAQLIHHTDREVMGGCLLGPVHPVSVVTPALRALGNIVTGSDAQTQAVIDAGALVPLRALLRHPKANLQKEAAWAVSNITAGTEQQIQAVVDAGLIEPLIEVLATGDARSQKEAVWAVTNLTSGGSLSQAVYALQAGVLQPVCDLLTVQDPKTLLVALDAIRNLLAAGERLNERDHVCSMIEEAGGLDKIEALQHHENTEVYRASLSIIEEFFSDESEDYSLAPEGGGDAFAFSAPAPIRPRLFLLSVVQHLRVQIVYSLILNTTLFFCSFFF